MQKELSEGDDTKAFCNEAIRVIWQYLGSKWQLPVSRQNKGTDHADLAEKDAPDDLRDETIELLRKLERSIYAPAISGSSSRELFEELESWITPYGKMAGMRKWILSIVVLTTCRQLHGTVCGRPPTLLMSRASIRMQTALYHIVE